MLNLWHLSRIATEREKLDSIKTELGAQDDASARPFLPAYRSLVGGPATFHYLNSRNVRLRAKHNKT